ncbi:serine/threonine protein kinase [Enhygromyxa salina]|uniref:Serine/threonine protein kinase n=1 Tax=Enhygromyxa salina TaxID=215803 RepID=A0A0C2D804_9BACT|nr:BREX system serine/threonine kinase PglW [Enhygromyxa salina]KIG17730.1 serine/threonine protein kinase [Enhygromyxa salina]
MTIVNDRFVLLGTTEHPHEKEALEFVRDNFPDHDPYHARGLVELLEAGSGRLYEIDLLVIGRHAVYMVEIKSHPGRMEGDAHAWRWTPPNGGRPREFDNPYSLANKKAKVLKSLLERNMPRDRQVPWVQPLIFMSAANFENRLGQEGRVAVVTRETVISAIKNGEFPGASANLRGRILNSPTARAVKQALDRIGLRPRKDLLQVGEYELGPVIADGDGYQDRAANLVGFKHIQHRARVYLVPDQVSAEHKQQLRRAAEREVQLLWSVRDSHNVLKSNYYAANGPLGPTLIFDDFDGSLRLDQFLAAHPDLPFDDRLEIIREVGHALEGCHRRSVFHGGISPEAVLVRRFEGALQVRLFNFQLGRSNDASATSHRSLLASRTTGAYQAPELASDPDAASAVTDTFSLGALAYFVFTTHAPAETSAELLQKLSRDGCLDPSAVVDDLPEPVIDLIQQATTLAADERQDNCAELVELLVIELRDETAVAESTAKVLEAEKGDILEERFEVRTVLGHGASARVLEVSEGGSKETNDRFALKIARGPAHDDRLRTEGEQLRDLRHPRIVQCHEILVIQERTCLLLSLAGTRSLQQLLADQGSLDLEFAGRYGEDLLDALKELEDRGILHRDIKPANLGVGSRDRLAKHLTLFDFSLLAAPIGDLEVGTTAYRDPFLPLRNAWDFAADRWSAAVTMHEMLTGLRPQYGKTGQSPLEPRAALRLESERFDAALRDRLISFFNRALARDPAERFQSANLMRRAWSALFEAPSVVTKGPAAPRVMGTQVELGTVTEEQLAQIQPDTPLRALPLSARAQNALDRAGLLRAEDLLALADNRLSAIRGIGRKVAKEILDLRNRWRDKLDQQASSGAAEPFFPDYRGDELLVDGIGLSQEAALALADAGLHTVSALCRAPKSQVEAVLERTSWSAASVHEIVVGLSAGAAQSDGPTSLGDWLDVLFPAPSRKSADHQRIQQLHGLREPFVGRTELTLQEVSDHCGISRQRLQQQVAKDVARWQGQPWRDRLRGLCVELVEDLGGAAPIEFAAQRLATKVPDDLASPPKLRLAQYASLLRAAAELGAGPEAGQLSLRRRSRRRLDGKGWQMWLLTGDEPLWAAVKQLGDRADELAQRQPLASSGETVRLLAAIVADTSLAVERIGPDRLLSFAAQASHEAARSSRLELYPIGMDAQRALELSAQALSAKSLSGEDIRSRVRARYPEAAPLPARPELDALVATLALQWVPPNEVHPAGTYIRPETAGQSSHHTSVNPVNRRSTAMPQARSSSEGSMTARDFEDALIAVIQERKLRVLAVNAAHMTDAIAELEQVLDTQAVEIDRRLIQYMEEALLAKGGKPDVLWTADAAGPEHKLWGRLVSVARDAATRLANELLPPAHNLLLVQAGLLARYELHTFIQRLLDANQSDESHAIVLLNPAHSGDRQDVLNNRLPISGLLPGQASWIPVEWLENQHRGAATSH